MPSESLVVLTRHLPSEVQKRMEKHWDLILVEGGKYSLIETLERNPGTRALISFLSDPIHREVLDRCPLLQIVANYAVGYNNIDVETALERKIWVTHTPDVLTEATADHTMALMLAVSRRIVEGDRFVRSGKFSGWASDLMLGRELSGSVLGVIGMGRIGEAVSRRASAFGMRVVYHSRNRKPELERKFGYVFRTFPELLRESDVISLHLPYSKDLHHLIDADEFSLMKPDAILLNVARGPLVNEALLARMLAGKRIAGAGLDVYEEEPRVHPDLLLLDNVVLAPHTGSATRTARTRMAEMVEESVTRALSGERPGNLIPQWRRLGPPEANV